ncbi:hypothetical protein BDN67DRAFT_880617, partial [Paxillus ammoniavirescens]
MSDTTPNPFSRAKFPVQENCPYFPFPSKAHFITSLLFGSARLPFSDIQKKAVHDWARELGVQDLPSLHALKKCQDEIEKCVGHPTEQVKSMNGNVFYINNIGKAIAKDYANPLTCYAMEDYPEDTGSCMSQVFNGEKMLLEVLSPPAARVEGKIYFVDELLQERSGTYFIPEHFFYASYQASSDPSEPEKLYALGQEVERTSAGFIVNDEQVIIPTSEFSRSFEDISANPGELQCGLTESSARFAKLEANPLRAKSQGRMVRAVPLIIFMDDVSGNISKQWNKHHTIYMSNANLPREMLEKEFCIQFVTGSPHAAPMELMQAMKDSICKAAESGIIAWDCKENEEMMLIPYALFFWGDNPMQAEMCSHPGLNCNYFCRTCNVGGTKVHKETEAGYSAIFSWYSEQPGILRTPEKTASHIYDQFGTACQSGATDKIKNAVSTTGISDSTTASIIETLVEMGEKLRKRGAGIHVKPKEEVRAALEKELNDYLEECSLKSAINPLLGLKGTNIHLDTPTEILHMILLGVVKYFWGQTTFLLEKAKLLGLFQIRLESIDQDGLNAPSLKAEYIVHYKGSLIGRHLKSLAQVMPYIIHDLVPKAVLDAWTTIGELIVLLWHTKICDTESYLAKLSKTIDDFLNITAQCAPSILIMKPKFHFLIHLPLYIRRFGPAIVFSTERYESFNSVFRLSCVHSNRQAPSRDSCKTFACQDIIKHIATGGYWFDKEIKKWVRGGSALQSYLPERPAQARLLGIKSESPLRIGMHCCPLLLTGKKSTPLLVGWQTTRCATKLQAAPHGHTTFFQGASFTAKSGDTVRLNGNVIFCHGADKKSHIGCIHEILLSPNHERNARFIAIQLFSLTPMLHPTLHSPCLELTNEEVIVSGQDVLCAVNIQHNCIDAHCVDIESKPMRQEQLETKRTVPVIQHKPTQSYFLNTWSIHNYEAIQSFLPQNLRDTPVRVTDVSEAQKLAISQLHDK